MNVFIFHGTGGFPDENWFPWMKKELESLGHKVIVPKFPTPENQAPETWFEVLDRYKESYTPDTILIGHSLGGAFLLRVLEKYDIKVKAAFIISAPVGILPIKNYEGDRRFLGKSFSFGWEKIKARCGKFFVFHSDNDPFVCLGNGLELSRSLGTKLILVENAGHSNAAAGYTKFDVLLDRIKKAL